MEKGRRVKPKDIKIMGKKTADEDGTSTHAYISCVPRAMLLYFLF